MNKIYKIQYEYAFKNVFFNYKLIHNTKKDDIFIESIF